MANRTLLPITVGEILLEEFIKPRGLHADCLAQALGLPDSELNAILHNSGIVTNDTAGRLGRYFETGPQFWLNLQSRFEEESQHPVKRIRKDSDDKD